MQNLEINASVIRLEAFRQYKKEIQHGICIYVGYVIKALSFQAKEILMPRCYGLAPLII
jgi:hypothetical protein